MTINHHPTVETLVELACGQLDLGRSVVVAAHLESCECCMRQLSLMETIGGAMLTEAAPEPLAADALARAFARIDAVESAKGGTVATVPAARPGDQAEQLPHTLRSLKMGRWQWIGPGIHRRMVELPDESGARVFLLKAAPGTRMPDHTHTGTELTLVLSGAFGHAGGRYGPGDFDEADDTVDHQPIVEDGEACICLVAMQGSLRLRGLAGRMLQPFIRI